MALLKALISAKVVEKVVDYLDSKNRIAGEGAYIPSRKPTYKGRSATPTARTAAIATAATTLVKRNPKLLVTFGAAGAAVFLANYLVKRKQQKPTYY
jgi:hypothetical protein